MRWTANLAAGQTGLLAQENVTRKSFFWDKLLYLAFYLVTFYRTCLPSSKYRTREIRKYDPPCDFVDLFESKECQDMADCGELQEEVKNSDWSPCLGESGATGLQNLTLSSMRGSIVVSRSCSTSSQCEVSQWSEWSSCQWSKIGIEFSRSN